MPNESQTKILRIENKKRSFETGVENRVADAGRSEKKNDQMEMTGENARLPGENRNVGPVEIGQTGQRRAEQRENQREDQRRVINVDQINSLRFRPKVSMKVEQREENTEKGSEPNADRTFHMKGIEVVRRRRRVHR